MASDSPDRRETIDESRPHIQPRNALLIAEDAEHLFFMDSFLGLFRYNGNVALSCRGANVSRNSIWRWVREDVDGFKAKFEEAAQDANERLEQEIFRRGVEGYKEPVFYKGAECGAIRKYSDILLIFLAKARMPGKYRDKFEGANVVAGDVYSFGNLSVGARNNIVNAIVSMPEEELRRLADRGRSPSPSDG